ncbi:uncharacterized protein LOC141537579 isoform X1 [Cotesia typhae]|uniref:uncharacterized protein LOC141537579 isoform X1 n=1 Tax=Cotesia typhae TaxID=2053667 RepID=UPI003D68B2C0
MLSNVNNYCCFNLKSGALILGILEIVLTTCILIVIGVDIIYQGICTPSTCSPLLLITSPGLLYLYIPICCCSLLLSFLMIWGSIKDNFALMMPYIYYRVIILMPYYLQYFYNAIRIFITEDCNTESAFVRLTFGICGLALGIHFCMVIYHHSKEIRNEKSNNANKSMY